MSETNEHALAHLARTAARFRDDEGLDIIRRHGGLGTLPLRFEVLKSGGTAVLLKTGSRGPVALHAPLTGTGAFIEFLRLHPSEDRALPGRRLLGDGKPLGELCASLLDLDRWTLVAYHPGRRAVVRLDGRDREGARAVFYAKLLKKRTFQRARLLYDTLGVRGERAGLVMPALSSDEQALFVFPRAPGRSLHEALRAGERPDVDQLAEGLRRLRSLNPPPGSLAIHDFEAERSAGLKMLDRGSALVPALGPLRRRVAGVEPPAHGPCGFLHRDLHDKQIFLGDGTMRFIDFDLAAMGAPCLDAVNLAEHCRLRTRQRRAPCGEDLGQDLLKALGIDLRTPETALYSGLTRARLAGVYALRPGWRKLSLELAASALRTIEEAQ